MNLKLRPHLSILSPIFSGLWHTPRWQQPHFPESSGPLLKRTFGNCFGQWPPSSMVRPIKNYKCARDANEKEHSPPSPPIRGSRQHPQSFPFFRRKAETWAGKVAAPRLPKGQCQLEFNKTPLWVPRWLRKRGFSSSSVKQVRARGRAARWQAIKSAKHMWKSLRLPYVKKKRKSELIPNRLLFICTRFFSLFLGKEGVITTGTFTS